MLWWLNLSVVLILACYGGSSEGAPSTVGVNWGSLSSHQMAPHIVVRMLKENGIKKVKLFDTDSWVLNAFKGSDIELMVGIPNDQLERIARSEKEAENYVKSNVSSYINKGTVNIKYIAVGNEPFLLAYKGAYTKLTLPAMVNVQSAIEKAGLGDQVKVTTPLNGDVYDSSGSDDKPSKGQFRKDISDQVKQILSFLRENKSPFVINIYPFLSFYQNKDFPDEFAFFDKQNNSNNNNGSKSQIYDDNNTYSNVFDANFDTLVWAMKRAGYSDLDIIVGEVGWPTDSAKDATPANAKRFYKGLLQKLAKQEGTPLYTKAIRMYLFALFDEDLKSIEPGNFERHWGIFRYDGVPKFPIDFSGQGREVWPEGAKGVRYLDRLWCVLNEKYSGDAGALGNALGYACGGADCTSLGINGSCSHLDLAGNASYAFNQYFQVRDQDVDTCKFQGLGTIVKDDPSKGTCLFRIEIESGVEMVKAGNHMGAIVVGWLVMLAILV